MIENLSLCLYLGNTSTINEQILVDYCSKYGQIRICSLNERKFRDFHLIEFENHDECQSFLQISHHQIDSIVVEVKSYFDLFDHCKRLNLDRKLYFGPIENPNNLNLIIQFYKLIDRNLQTYFLDNQYLLIEFSNENYRQVIFKQNTLPKTLDNQIYEIHLPIYPKDYRNYQIYIRGLNEQITKEILLQYFEQQATIVSCQMKSRLAIIEFDDEEFIVKLLENPKFSLNGIELSISRLSQSFEQIILNENKQFENELVQIKLEYERKFVCDRSFLDQAFNRLIAEQRIKLIKLENLIKRL